MSRKKSVYRSLAEINITSLVDVTLCLFLVFVLLAPYIQGGVEVNLPEAQTREVIVEEGPVISITSNRQIYFEEEAITMDELGTRLSPYLDQRDTIPIYLRGDEEIPYGFVLRVMAAVEREGFLHLNLVADQESL
jgi:biopolymer transport protein ExbD